MGSDCCQNMTHTHAIDFNPRSPCGERLYTPATNNKETDFNPRSPCGERHNPVVGNLAQFLFQSTLPLWGATGRYQRRYRRIAISIHAPPVGSDVTDVDLKIILDISIHAPPVGSDQIKRFSARTGNYFNPRSPCGERLHGGNGSRNAGAISIHAPPVGSD